MYVFKTNLYSRSACRETGGQSVGREKRIGMAAGWSEKEDTELLVFIQDSNHHAFAELVTRHNKKFYSLAYRYVGARDEAEDIVQEAFIKLWEKPLMWQESRGNKFTTWFYKVIVNLCLDRKKKKRNLPLDEKIQIEDEKESHDKTMVRNEAQKVLESEIAALPERQQTALNLCFYEGLSNKEAAEIMGVNLKALQSLLMRAKANLKEKLQDFI